MSSRQFVLTGLILPFCTFSHMTFIKSTRIHWFPNIYSLDITRNCVITFKYIFLLEFQMFINLNFFHKQFWAIFHSGMLQVSWWNKSLKLSIFFFLNLDVICLGFFGITSVATIGFSACLRSLLRFGHFVRLRQRTG